MAVRITCVTKPSGNIQNPHEAISQYGWLNETTQETGVADRASMVDWVKKGNQAYVKDFSGNTAYCDARENSNGTEYLQTYSDQQWTNNLLSLPSCV